MTNKPTVSPHIYSYRFLADKLIHAWLNYENTGTTVHDLATVGTSNGTFNGALTWGSSSLGTGPIIVASAKDKWIDLATPVVLTPPFTLGWRAANAANNGQGAIVGRNDASTDYIRMNGPSGGIEFKFGGGGLLNFGTSQNVSTPFSYWHFTYSGSSVSVYRDSTLVLTFAYAGSRVLTIKTLLRAVSGNDALDMIGNDDFLFVWGNYAATQSDITTLVADPFLTFVPDVTVYQAGTLTIPGVLATQLDLTMNAATNGTQPYTYQLQRGTDGITFGANVGAALTGQTTATATWTDTGLTTATLYYYRVQVTDSTGTPVVVNSNIASATPTALTLGLTNPVASFFVQRVTDGGANLAAPVCGGNSGPIACSGTYSGGIPLAVEYTINGGSTWATLADQISLGTLTGGAWSRNLTSVPQGQFDFQIRAANDHSNTTTHANVRVGELFWGYGQSNMAGQSDVNQTYVATGGLGASIWKTSAWAECVDPTNNEGNTRGSWIPLFLSRMVAVLGVPCAFENLGQSGQGLAFDNGTSQPTLAPPSGDGRGHNYWTGSAAVVTTSKANAVRAVLFNHGEADEVSGITQVSYYNALINLRTYVAAFLGAPEMFISQVTGPGGLGLTSALASPVIKAQYQYRAFTGTGGGTVYFLDTEIHPQSSGDPDLLQVKIADYFVLAILEKDFAGTALSGRGPVLANATFNALKTTTTVVFDRALKTADTFVTGLWAVSDSGGARTVSGVAYHGTNPNAIVVTHAASVGASPIISYGSVNNAPTVADPTGGASSHNSGASSGVQGNGAGAVKGTATTLTAPTGFPTAVSLFAEPFVSQAISSLSSGSSIFLEAAIGIGLGI